MDMKIIILVLCFFSLSVADIAYSSECNSYGSSGWFHVNANVFRIKYVLPLNMSSNTNITLDVAIPENNYFQKLINISFEPSPNLTFADANNLTHVRYKLTTVRPRFLNITIYYTVRVLFSSLVENISESGKLEEVPTDIQTKYTERAPYIESNDPTVISSATMIIENVTDIDSKVTKLFNFVSNKTLFEYDESVQNITRNSYSHIRGALWALQTRRGVCFDFAHLFVALLRAVDIPSRVAEGIILDGRAGFILHNWAEVYFVDIGWVPYDPTWDEAKCNIHMKILNPLYDQQMRWNYSINNGWLYRFPENSSYVVNDYVSIENITKAELVDVLIRNGDSNFNLTRTLSLSNETFTSSIYIMGGYKSVNNYYGFLGVNLSKNILGFQTISYETRFMLPQPKSMQLEISIPWNLIFSKSIIPSLSSLNCSNPLEKLSFVSVEPVLWIAIVLVIVGLLIILTLFIVKQKLRDLQSQTK